VSFVLSSDGDFRPGAVESSEEPEQRTTIAYPEGAVAMAELVATWLSPSAELVEDPDLQPAHVRVTLGADFERVAAPDETTPTTAAPVEGAEPGVPATTTTTQPGWTPGQAPVGVTCT
jgi:hypothetical protein